MNKTEFEQIVEKIKDCKNLSNTSLVSLMDELTNEFELTKSSIINYTYYLDKVEELYNIILKEYQSRNK
jgi:hypothetical protein